MLQRLPIGLAQVKAGNTSENLPNQIRQIWIKQKKQQYNEFNSIKLKNNGYYIYELLKY